MPQPKEPTFVTSKGKYMGWVSDQPDFRDYEFAAKRTPLPKTIRLDLEPAMPSVYDQLKLGSCVSNSVSGSVEFDLRKQGLADFMPSRLFLYYNGRVMEGTPNQDSGLMVRDGIKVTVKQGLPPESMWPYNIDQFTQPPPGAVYAEALKTLTTSYARVARRSLRAALVAGHMIPFGFSVYSSFETVGKNGIVSMPTEGEQYLGGHSPAICGYDTINGELYYRVRNSWGPKWADKGYCWFPEEYIMNTKLSSDFWVIKTVS